MIIDELHQPLFDEPLPRELQARFDEVRTAAVMLELHFRSWWRFGRKFRTARKRLQDALDKLSDCVEWHWDGRYTQCKVIRRMYDIGNKVFVKYGGTWS